MDSLQLDLKALRAEIRAGRFQQSTAGCAPGRMQANIVILPREHSADFRTFCELNPKPCPLLAVSEPGSSRLPMLGSEIDVRSDLPGYRIWRDGKPLEESKDIFSFWRDDLVTFAIGCSYGFEASLIAAGISLPHVDAGRKVAMYDTNLPLLQSGPFGGRMVVSMRRIPEHRLEDVVEISGNFPQCHGTPVHIGDPGEIGIEALGQPDYGDPPGDAGVPVFWACGVTPQAVLRRACLAFAITHSPGKMLVCDVPDTWNQLLNSVS